MKQAETKKIRRPIALHVRNRLREGLLITSFAVALFLLVSFCSYHANDPGWSSTGLGNTINNWGGRGGAFLADWFLSIFGIMSYLFPPVVVFAAWVGLHYPESGPFKWYEFLIKVLGSLLIFVSGCGMIALFQNHGVLYASGGGILGDVTLYGLTAVFNTQGTALILLTAFLCGITFFTGLSWFGSIDAIGCWLMRFWQRMQVSFKQKTKPPLIKIHEEPELAPRMTKVPFIKKELPLIKPQVLPKFVPPKKVAEVPLFMGPSSIPPLSLLDSPPLSEGKAFSQTTLEELSHLVEQRLSDFGVAAKVVAVHPGPIITRFECDLAPGIKVSKITGLAKDIARSLSVNSVRVVEVIPGKSYIGLELPNEHRELVCLRDILESPRYIQSRSPLSLGLGKDISGYPVVVDLAKMPHLLVAGTTGSGKSVSINAMLLSFLFKATPEQLRLIMIDPKMLELSVYEGIPHLLTPVITDMKDAANALRWCVAEMDKRYRLMASLGVRNLTSFNLKVVEARKQDVPLAAPDWLLARGDHPSPHLETMPVIVVVIDELADLMMVVGRKVEELVTRIAQKARAAGIHLLLATQRPSVDVITGLIKANVPTRIAFQVSSRIDSRTILDQQGAEQLLGNGDMLYLPPGTGVPVRVHGAYVSDDEVHRVVAAWQNTSKPDYIEGITQGDQDMLNGTEDGDANGESDPLYDEALRIVTESRRASISLVQRRLRIGYNRAARIMEVMESAGVVSAMDTNGTREVLAPPPPEN